MAVAAIAALLYLGAAYVIAASERYSKRQRTAERGGSFKGSERFQGSMVGVNDYPTSQMGAMQAGYPDPYMMTAAYQYPEVGNYGYPVVMGYDNTSKKY